MFITAAGLQCLCVLGPHLCNKQDFLFKDAPSNNLQIRKLSVELTGKFQFVLWSVLLTGTRVKKKMDVEMGSKRALSLMCLFLTVLHISTPSSAQKTTLSTASTTTKAPSTDGLKYSTQPSNISVGVGEPAVFHCGVPEVRPNLTFTLYGSNHNYSLTCPGGHVEDIPQAVYGSCEMKNGESLAMWTLLGTAFPDNGTRVVCQQLSNPRALSAVLHVYDTGATNVLLIGCILGGFFGVLLVAALLYIFLVKSESFQECFGGEETEDDMTTIVSTEQKKKSSQDVTD